MFQDFEVRSRPEDGVPRVAALRAAMAEAGLDGFLVPRADRFQGEYVAPCDDRLAWLTGFTGSAGFAAVLADRACVFVDGRYRVQVKAQVALAVYTPVDWPEVKLADWLRDALPAGGRVGFDPWLHTIEEMATLRAALAGSGVELVGTANLVDAIWSDRPGPPAGAIEVFPDDLAGRSAAEKRADCAAALIKAGEAAAVLTLPDGINWLLNIRGRDIPRNPVVQAMAILHADGGVDLFLDPGRVDAALAGHLGPEVRVRAPEEMETALTGLGGPVRLDRSSAPQALADLLEAAGIAVSHERDPTVLPKARKTAAEIAATRAAHLRDGAAMVRFLSWLDAEAPKGGLTEIDVVRRLEGVRRDTNALRDISFDTICGAGPNGAIVHYRVSEETNRPVRAGEVLLVDSGGQYADGTTDITRTIAVGDVPQEAREAFTQVLQGMIAIHRARFPKGVSGAHLDALARAPLWAAGRDFDHGTGHGVGVYLSVHEGPQRLSRVSTVPLDPGMILSNEPGYYREGAFGIRIENLIVVVEAPPLPGGDAHRAQLAFETLTWVPIDRRMVVAERLSPAERNWLNGYHAEVLARIGPLVEGEVLAWLERACAAI
ncbi:aminopeptidase P family protein [Roseicyclus marinus]|uniref:aminopeptidase P family protein n=1 Tax=Roseicyclus marinus TaxID=2161673 RepID=UPI00240FF63B|nr:aminopeptidase P family protein [Roseicyclus marinus]MDG3042293.1 aminopeptidase P family protein [Roseicyclus marinus]